DAQPDLFTHSSQSAVSSNTPALDDAPPNPFLASAVTPSTTAIPSGIVNGSFAVSDTSSPQFGWATSGSISVVNGQALLAENGRTFPGLSQSLIVPAGVTALQFTITGLNLAPNGPAVAPDAFEAALLDQNLISLVGTATNLSGTDAFLNIQQTGAVFF